MSETDSITCFDQVPSIGLVPYPAIIIGGTWLLREFLHVVAGNGGQLSIAVPFIEDRLASDRWPWAEMDHSHIDLVIVTQRATDGWKAWSELRDFPWRSSLICRCENLHAKVYAFVSNNRLATCLVGSHNLTPSGLTINLEVGVLFRSENVASEVFKNVVECREYVIRLAQSSNVLIDTRQWPTGASENTGGRYE